jgi:5'-nucleotidase
MESTSGEDAPKHNPIPSALVSNLQSVLAARRPSVAEVSTAATASKAEALA